MKKIFNYFQKHTHTSESLVSAGEKSSKKMFCVDISRRAMTQGDTCDTFLVPWVYFRLFYTISVREA